jgi:REP element-mobilizing transposase RayT
MARPTRIDFPGAWYHVLNRGIEKRSIFRSQRCYERFIELLSALPQRFGLKLHGYVLMPNHYHLQVETPEANLSRAIHWLNVSYSVWLNRKYRRVGPLFHGRFKAILHEPEEGVIINRYITSIRFALRPRAVTKAGQARRLASVRRSLATELRFWSNSHGVPTDTLPEPKPRLTG